MFPVEDKDCYKSKYQSQFLLMLHNARLIGQVSAGAVSCLVRIPMRDGVCARIACVYHEFAWLPPGEGFAIVTMSGMTASVTERYPLSSPATKMLSFQGKIAGHFILFYYCIVCCNLPLLSE